MVAEQGDGPGTPGLSCLMMMMASEKALTLPQNLVFRWQQPVGRGVEVWCCPGSGFRDPSKTDLEGHNTCFWVSGSWT